MVGSPGAVGERLAQVTARPIFVNLTAQGYVRFTAGRTHLVGHDRPLVIRSELPLLARLG